MDDDLTDDIVAWSEGSGNFPEKGPTVENCGGIDNEA